MAYKLSMPKSLEQTESRAWEVATSRFKDRREPPLLWDTPDFAEIARRSTKELSLAIGDFETKTGQETQKFSSTPSDEGAAFINKGWYAPLSTESSKHGRFLGMVLHGIVPPQEELPEAVAGHSYFVTLIAFSLMESHPFWTVAAMRSSLSDSLMNILDMVATAIAYEHIESYRGIFSQEQARFAEDLLQLSRRFDPALQPAELTRALVTDDSKGDPVKNFDEEQLPAINAKIELVKNGFLLRRGKTKWEMVKRE